MQDEHHATFDELVGKLADAESEQEEGEFRKVLWERFGATGAAFISDMANFSSTSRSLGITHFLKLIHRARRAIRPIVEEHGGILLKFDADNCYAFFEDPGDAVQASLAINEALFRDNQLQDLDEHIYLSVGIDYGDLLLIGDSDFYGDPVNTASKLGEDLAIKGETLVTERALNRTTLAVSENTERMIARVSDIEISYLRLPMTQTRRETTS